MKAYLFPGQGSQYVGMGKFLHENYPSARLFFDEANEILGFDIAGIMFSGTPEQLKETNITQPAIFLHSTILADLLRSSQSFNPQMVAGHSLGEFSALVAAGALSFQDGLKLVHQRALAMQDACKISPSTMAAVIGLDDDLVEDVCTQINEVVVAANYNSPGQLVISGTHQGVEIASQILKEKGASRVIPLPVGGAFHSPLMEPARVKLAAAIEATSINKPICPIYQNVVALPISDPAQIKQNLIDQLTSPVKWTQIIQNMIADGATSFTEVGPGKALQGMVKKIDRSAEANGVDDNYFTAKCEISS